MIEVDVNVKDIITQATKQMQKELQKLPQEGLIEFKALTPIKTGNARRNTNLHGDTIQAKYPYAQRLDEGWSKQAPTGMTKPWERWLQKRLKQILGR